MSHLQDFVSHLIAKHDADEAIKPEVGNRALDMAIRAFRMSLQDANWIEQVKPLVDHPNETVRVWTCAILLFEGYEPAVRRLEEDAKLPGIHGAIAETTLSEWRSGNLDPYWLLP